MNYSLNIPYIIKASFLLLISAIISFGLTPPTIVLAKKLGLVTDKRKRKHPAHTHHGVIPRAGGLPIFIAIFSITLLFLPLNKIILTFLIGSLITVGVGLFDDYQDISPYTRFLINLLVSALIVSAGVGIPFISNPFGGIIHLDKYQWTIHLFGTHKLLIIADIVSILWLAWTTNMTNWSKGVDGQLPGFVAITAIFLGIVSQRFGVYNIETRDVLYLSFIVAGAFIGFLPFNFYPQKIMPGYDGGALAGLSLGVLSLLSFGKVGTAILILAIPTIDALYTMIRRVAHKKSPFKADWGHFHHRLLEIGWGRRRIAIFYWTITFIFGIAGLFFSPSKKIIIFLTTAIILFFFILSIEKIRSKEN